jgi:hypothetical protein
MKNLKTILVTTLASLFTVLTVVNISMVSPKSTDENSLNMLEIMTRAFDESEGGILACVKPMFRAYNYLPAEAGTCYYFETNPDTGEQIMIPCGLASICFYDESGGHCQSHECIGDGIIAPQ